RRSGRLGWRRLRPRRLARVVIGDDASDGGENLLHRRLLRLRGLVHGRILVTHRAGDATPLPTTRESGPDFIAQRTATIAGRRPNASKSLWTGGRGPTKAS